MNRLRKELFQKILIMPIGYFTEQRKGDMMSRMTNDVGELENSVVGTVEGLIKDPLNLLILLTTLIFISPKLSLFLLIFLPVTGFIIGRISRTLKKQSNDAAIKQGEALSVLDETLGGLRVIKAFTAEKLVGKKFEEHNEDTIPYQKQNAVPQRPGFSIIRVFGRTGFMRHTLFWRTVGFGWQCRRIDR